MEKSKPVDQLDANRGQTWRLDQVRSLVLARRELFAREGSVVATWRTRGGRRFGPYYRLAYREAGRQKSLYLGTSASLADQVRGLLAELQAPRRHRDHLRRLIAHARAALRRQYAQLNRELAAVGYCLKGREIRRLRPANGGLPCPASPARAATTGMLQAGEKAENLSVVNQQETGEARKSGKIGVLLTNRQWAVGAGQKCGATPHEGGQWAVGNGRRREDRRPWRVDSGQKCRESRHGSGRWGVGGGQKRGATPHVRPKPSSCPSSSCLARRPARRQHLTPSVRSTVRQELRPP